MNTAVCIYLDKDSIFHGDLQFIYTTKNKEISLVKSENYSPKALILTLIMALI